LIRWLFYLPLSLLASVLCYITNPIVLLFCDEDGELPGPLHLWQTWDNSCNPSDIKEIAPAWLLYDWDAHYREYKDTTQILRAWNRDRWFTECNNKEWTMGERIKRYLCRLLWLTRNNAYGWGFYVLGATVSPLLLVDQSKNTVYVDEVDGDAWMYKNDAPIISLFGYTLRWKNIIGWKIALGESYDTRAMIANRIAFSIKKEE